MLLCSIRHTVDAVGLGAALDYTEHVGLEAIFTHEHDLLLHATHLLTQIPGLQVLGTAKPKTGFCRSSSTG